MTGLIATVLDQLPSFLIGIATGTMLFLAWLLGRSLGERADLSR